MEDTDTGLCHQNMCENGQYCNLGNQEKCIRCFETSTAESNGGRLRVPDQCRPQKVDMDLQTPQSQMAYPATRSAGTKAQMKDEWERQTLWQRGEAERSPYTQQTNSCWGLMSVNEEQSVLKDQVRTHVPQEQYRKKENRESAMAEQQHPSSPNDIPSQFLSLTCKPMQDSPDPERPNETDEMLNADYTGNVYSEPVSYSVGQAICAACENSENVYTDLYEIYSFSDQVYEKICDVPASLFPFFSNEKQSLNKRKTSIQHLQSKERDRHHHLKEAVGSRLRHYTQRSDGELDSPEKDAEFAQPRSTASCDLDEDNEQTVAELNQSLGPQNLGSKAKAKKRPLKDHSEPTTQITSNKNCEAASREDSVTHQVLNCSDETLSMKNSQEKADAISLVIKDIKEAIEEVKTRTIRSPYTPDEPKEPVWVMRQDLSSNTEYDFQPFPGDDVEKHEEEQAKQKEQTDQAAQSESPGSGSSSPPGAGSSSKLLSQDEGFRGSLSHKESRKRLTSFPTYVEVPGPCDPEDLIDGIIFAANCLGSTQMLSEKTPSKNIRMIQAQEAVNRIKAEPQPITEVDLFISTQRIKVLNADSQETMIDNALRTISYIADIGNIVVLMARRRLPHCDSQENVEVSDPSQDSKHQHKMICHVFESEDAQLIAQSIGQAFSVAYQEFLRANGINPEDLSQTEYSDLMSTQDMYNEDLVHFSRSENCKDVCIEKAKGEILGVVIVESGWGSILPTVIIANMMHAGPAERSGRVNIGDQIMSINGTSLVGLPLSTCQSIIKGLKNQSRIKLNIVRCPPVTTVLIRRPDMRYQLGFSVQNGIICSLMRGGIAERGGVRVGHRIIEINNQSVVATPHEKIVQILSNAVGEIHMKTMPAAMYRLLTAQEQPLYI
ncbi:amyloid-beta A4 precursor protein-binding family A member 1 isoform X2 [Xiphophorus couchianus]|uniref:amyloid-beta A4 precursor protein-binding family A member 1 isoform X2 n=1 Tax=Xiphophorus couchianus TaxID=32473 RepID=UPI0010165C66|nr:amyloid-beta A4 precursor protein-binding family A member 1 isoform X2 [Xiphophorus couchianus]